MPAPGSPRLHRAHSGPAWGLRVITRMKESAALPPAGVMAFVFRVCELPTPQNTGRSSSASSAEVSRSLGRWGVSPRVGSWSRNQSPRTSPFLKNRPAGLDSLESWTCKGHISPGFLWTLEGILVKTEWSVGTSDARYIGKRPCRVGGGRGRNARCMAAGAGFTAVKLWLPQLLAP